MQYTRSRVGLRYVINRKNKMMTIKFYSTQNEFGEFSNFSAHGIEMNEQWYKTTEHYFQSQKFEDAGYREKIRIARTPKDAANLGRSRKVKLRDDWENIKIDIMRDAVRKKVNTHVAFKKILLSTGEEELIEAAPGDYFWGCGKDGNGKNWLGIILMEIRKELQQGVSGEKKNDITQ